MFRHLAPVSFLAVAAAFLSSSPAQAGVELCEALKSTECANGCYSYVAPIELREGATCVASATHILVQDDISKAPEHTGLKCKRAGSGYLCEAWPQGEELSYTWASEQSSTVSAELASPFQNFSCSGGAVVVSVAGPTGESTEVSVTLPACN